MLTASVAYESVRTTWEYGDKLFAVLMIWGIDAIPFVIHVTVLTMIEFYIPALHRFKIQPGKYPSPTLVRQALKESLMTFLVMNPIATLLCYDFVLYFNPEFVSGPLPEFSSFLWQFIVFYVLEDTLFYWIHRLLHTRYLYNQIHRKHHQFKTPIGLMSEYAHPIEGIFGFFLPAIAGPILLLALGVKVHLVTVCIWILHKRTDSVDGHSGYNLPVNWLAFILKGGNSRHDFHHAKIHSSYGGTLFWDWLMNTDALYNQQNAQSKIKKNA
jgi:sterol desaturase/sphingolipid hydroxylase (fatty acid hydroxylase superfamily)